MTQLPIENIIRNQTRLRTAANELLKSIGNSELTVSIVKPHIESLISQVQNYIKDHANGYEVCKDCEESRMQPQRILDERQRIALRMKGFNQKENSTWFELTRRFGSNVKRSELTSIAQVLADATNIILDRDAKRRKSVLLKWFDEHWLKLRPLLDYIVLDKEE